MIRKTLNLALLAGTLLGAQGYAALHTLDAQDTGLTLSGQNLDGMELELSFNELESFSVETAEGFFTELRLDGCGYTQELGTPKLPVFRKTLRVPVGATVEASVSSQSSQDLQMDGLGMDYPVMPVQPSLSKSQNPADVPFEHNPAAYSQSNLDSEPEVKINELGFMRGLRLVQLEVSAVQLDHNSGVLRVHNNLDLQVSYTGADWDATRELEARTRSPYFESLYESSVFNYESSNSRDTITEYPVKYVIVTDPGFTAQLADFVAWKTMKGFEVIVGEVGSLELGSSTTSIKSWLQSLYNAGTPASPAPSFILYVGDDNLVPAWDGDEGSHITDLDYVLYEGSDMIPEVYYGRFSARDAAQLQAQIDKTMMYEQYTMPDPSYLAESVLIAGVDSGYAPTHGNGQINYGTTNYFNAAHGITSHTYLYPLSDESWVSDAIIENVSDGAGFVNYTAHGSQTSWADPSFTISDINGLDNAGMYPTVVGNCCLTNSFQVETCFGEAWLRAADKGAIGYIGGSNNTYWDEDYWWGVGAGPIDGNGPTYAETGMGAYDASFHDHGEGFAEWYTTQAALMVRGNLAVVDGGSSRIDYYWEIYHLMGDPSLSTWMGEPTTNNASLPDVIFLGQNSISITAAPYSYVGLSVNGELRGSGLVDASGMLTLEFSPFTVAGDADLVVTHHQHQPIIAAIPCVPNDGAYVTLNSYTPLEATFGQTVSLDVTLENIGTVTATDVDAALSIVHPFVTVTDASQAYGVVADGATSTQNNAFSFDLLSGVTDQDLLRFDLVVSGQARDTWNAYIDVTANAPQQMTGNISVDDQLHGNGNGRLDPGETAYVLVPVLNNGHASGVEGLAELTSSSAYITITAGSAMLGPISAGGENVLVAEVVVDAEAPVGTPAGFQFNFESGDYDVSKSFTYPIGLVLEDWESGSFVSFPWEHGADADWTIAADAYEGMFAAKSGTISHNDDSQLHLTVDIQNEDDISFMYSVSSESNYDYLRFYIDGVQQAEWAGDIAWSLASFPVTIGTHTFMWSYEKDGSVSNGSDCAWIDYIVFPALGLPPAPSISIDPLQVETWVEAGFIGTEYVNMANLGEGELSWSSSVNTAGAGVASIPLMKLEKGQVDPRQGRVSRDAGGPDVFGYSWVDSNSGAAFEWVEISSSGVALGLGDDSNSGDLALGFSMPFYGDPQSSVRVCSNGWLSFSSSSTSYSNQGIPLDADPNNLIAPFWDDLNPNSGGEVYYLSDTANNRFIVQWDEVPRYGNTDALETFQAILYADGRIVFQYQTVSDVNSVTVGIESADGMDGLEVVANAAYLVDGLAIEFSSEEPWLVVTPAAGTILAGGSQQLSFDFNAMNLVDGDYNATVSVSSNDPDTPVVEIPVLLHVGLQALDTPFLAISSPSACATHIDWEPIEGATAYRIWSRIGLGGAWTLEGTTTYSFYDIDCIVPGTVKVFRVTAINE